MLAKPTRCRKANFLDMAERLSFYHVCCLYLVAFWLLAGQYLHQRMNAYLAFLLILESGLVAALVATR